MIEFFSFRCSMSGRLLLQLWPPFFVFHVFCVSFLLSYLLSMYNYVVQVVRLVPWLFFGLLIAAMGDPVNHGSGNSSEHCAQLRHTVQKLQFPMELRRNRMQQSIKRGNESTNHANCHYVIMGNMRSLPNMMEELTTLNKLQDCADQPFKMVLYILNLSLILRRVFVQRKTS